MKYRKKPVVVDAEQWFKYGDNPAVLQPGIGDSRVPLRYFDEEGHAIPLLEPNGWIGTLEGGHCVTPGDWIITGVKGEKYPCKPDIFTLTYDLVRDIP